MEEDVRYREELMRWNQRMAAALRNLSAADESELREWQGQHRAGQGADNSDWPGWERLIGKKPISGREERSLSREERLAKIAADETPVPLDHVPRVVVHMMPHKKQELDLANGVDREVVRTHLAPMVARYMRQNRYGVDVSEAQIVSFTSGEEGVSSYAYSQLFPDGSVEHVRASYYDTEHRLIGLDYEDDVVDAVGRGLLLQEALGVEAPIAVTLSLIGIAGCRFSDGALPPKGEPIKENEIKVGEVIFSKHQPRTDADVAALMKNGFDTVRRAARLQPRP